MATKIHDEVNGNAKKDEHVEPLGELQKPKADVNKEADLCNVGDGNGCETLAEKEEPLPKISTSNKQKAIAPEDVAAEVGADAPDGNDYSSEEEGEGEGEGDGDGDGDGEDVQEGEGEPYEEDDDEYVDDGEDDEGDDDEAQPPPQKRRK